MDCVESISDNERSPKTNKISKTNNMPSPYTTWVIKKEVGQRTTCDWAESIAILDYVCSQIADRYDLFSKGQPRKATIIEVLAKNPCIACVDKALRAKNFQRIDNMYSELHQLACSLLIEELYTQLVKIGHRVAITTEENLKYGKVDVFIIPCKYGLSLHSNHMEIAVEVKTGFSLSVPQLLRYLIDNNRRSLILWRIRNQQVLLFEAREIEELLMQFVKMIVSRGERLLEAPEFNCGHSTGPKSWSPNSQQLQETFSDFSKGIIKTLPSVVEAVVTKFEREMKQMETDKDSPNISLGSSINSTQKSEQTTQIDFTPTSGVQ